MLRPRSGSRPCSRSRRRTLRLAVPLGLGLLVAACGGGDDDEPATGYGTELRADFVEECTAAGTAEDVCGCLYDRIEAEVPFETFRQLDEQLRSGDTSDLPVDIEAMAVACAADPDSATTVPDSAGG